MNPGLVILILQLAVGAVTVLLICSLLALTRGWYRVHGRINLVFFALTLSALVGLELIARVVSPAGVFDEYLDRHDAKGALYVHLAFSVPSALLLVAMLFTGLRHRRAVHIGLGICFVIFWIGTVVTGICFLPVEL
jgi:hypothetical protein